ncbi:AraC family transcriptional regulator [Nonomuraea sp. NPDC050790]|uniref:AraC family transcriptional regulator n=1 Tax=Nonomuraea sp. NPDC050790 TaxID=3364371 RepID=UPI00378C98C9
MWTRMSSDDIAATDRTDWYQDVVARTIAPHRIKIADPAGFHASAKVLKLGHVEVSRHVQSDHRSWRTPRLIRHSDPETYLFGLITRGRKAISQRRTVSTAGPGDAVLFDTSHPYMAGSPGPEVTAVTVLHVPRALIGLPQDRLDAALGRRFTTRQGIGAVFRRFLTAIDAHATECAPSELPALERTTLELLSGLLAQQLGAWPHLPGEAREQVLLRRIDAFIDRHLAEVWLTPRNVAARHHVSVRALYSLFEGRGETVAAAIRRRRLERCREDLTRLPLPVGEIGARWGFPNASSFSRAFRRAYGASPSSYRQPPTGTA